MKYNDEQYRYPDADAVMRAVEGSGRRHLLLTGGRGCGKTTLLKAFCRGAVLPGITTKAVVRDCVTLTDNLSGETVVVGKYDPTLPGTGRKMRPTADGFSRIGTQMLYRCADAAGEWASVDEIGYLEQGCAVYMSALAALMNKKRLIAAVRRDVLSTVLSLVPREDVFVLDLDCVYGRAGCVIMASGMGVRFGGNKLMADFGGAPMIRRILDATDGIFARRIVVTRHADVADFCSARDVEVLLHNLPLRSDTVRLGLEAIGGVVGACMFCPGDQPLLDRRTVAALAMAAADAEDHGTMFRAAYADTVGAPVIFPAWTFPALLALPAGKGGGYVLKAHPERVRTVLAGHPLELTDADTKETLQQLQAALLSNLSL